MKKNQDASRPQYKFRRPPMTGPFHIPTFRVTFYEHFAASNMCYWARAYHIISLDQPNNISWCVNIMKLLIMQFSEQTISVQVTSSPWGLPFSTALRFQTPSISMNLLFNFVYSVSEIQHHKNNAFRKLALPLLLQVRKGNPPKFGPFVKGNLPPQTRMEYPKHPVLKMLYYINDYHHHNNNNDNDNNNNNNNNNLFPVL
jgi:hypothetical protein